MATAGVHHQGGGASDPHNQASPPRVPFSQKPDLHRSLGRGVFPVTMANEGLYNNHGSPSSACSTNNNLWSLSQVNQFQAMKHFEYMRRLTMNQDTYLLQRHCNLIIFLNPASAALLRTTRDKYSHECQDNLNSKLV